VCNRSIVLLPNQAISISGGRGSQIVMDEWTSVGDLPDQSRVILDALCLLKITKPFPQSGGRTARIGQ
jgi:hypothetical protein